MTHSSTALCFRLPVIALLLLSSSAVLAMPSGAGLELDDDLVALAPPADASAEEFEGWVLLAGDLDPQARQELLSIGRRALPAVVNAMLGFDYTTKKGSRQGRDCHRFLAELLGRENESSWVVTDDPAKHEPNLQLIRGWHRRAELCLDSEEEWWRLRGHEPGALLSAVTSTGLPGWLELELLQLQAELEQALGSFESERAAAASELARLEQEGLQSLRIELAESLPDAWEEEQLQGARIPSASLIAGQLRGGLEIDWPLGLRESLRDTLRSSERDAWVDQRTIRVDGLSEDIEVSVKTYGDSQYGVVPLVRTWPEARDICLANGGHLACITSFDELETVLSLMSAVDVSNSDYLDASEWNKLFWVGATDAAKEGDWRWLDGRPVDTGLWLQPTLTAQGRPREMPWGGGGDSPQPSNAAGMEHCGGLVRYRLEPQTAGEEEYRWGMMDWYGGFPARFICEWGPEQLQGPWEGEAMRVMEPYLLEYFRKRLELEEGLVEERLAREKSLRRDRKKALTAARSLARGGARAIQARLSSERKSMTGFEIVATERLCWLLEDPDTIPEPEPLGVAVPQDAVRLLGSSYKVLKTPKTHAEAQEACRKLGGRLMTWNALPAARDLVVGSESPDLDLIHSDLQLQLCLALLREADVELAWLGYRRYGGWGDEQHPDRKRWIQLHDRISVEGTWLVEELRPSFTLIFNGWPYHTIGGMLSSLELSRRQVSHLAESSTQSFPSPYASLPEYMIKARIDGAPVTEEQKGETGRGFAFEGPEGGRQVSWLGMPFSGGERISFHPSPINSGPIHFRLPCICVWDS